MKGGHLLYFLKQGCVEYLDAADKIAALAYL